MSVIWLSCSCCLARMFSSVPVIVAICSSIWEYTSATVAVVASVISVNLSSNLCSLFSNPSAMSAISLSIFSTLFCTYDNMRWWAIMWERLVFTARAMSWLLIAKVHSDCLIPSWSCATCTSLLYMSWQPEVICFSIVCRAVLPSLSWSFTNYISLWNFESVFPTISYRCPISSSMGKKHYWYTVNSKLLFIYTADGMASISALKSFCGYGKGWRESSGWW